MGKVKNAFHDQICADASRREERGERDEPPDPRHKRCGDCVTIRGVPFCTMNCSGVNNSEKAYL